MTDWLHMKPLNASRPPVTKPDTTQIAPSHLPVIVRNSSMPSMSMLLPRETISPSNPHASAPAKALPNATRQAMLLKGIRLQK
ncbi:MAG: hypothetical protein BWX84_01315 [Verrucomicrobia bacterium ADurb.Bin118]|nr:MAG: hypothetical protein BWX84_01315 [Verrucomicrobia bacterium ADurb.Bin118]